MFDEGRSDADPSLICRSRNARHHLRARFGLTDVLFTLLSLLASLHGVGGSAVVIDPGPKVTQDPDSHQGSALACLFFPHPFRHCSLAQLALAARLVKDEMNIFALNYLWFELRTKHLSGHATNSPCSLYALLVPLSAFWPVGYGALSLNATIAGCSPKRRQGRDDLLQLGYPPKSHPGLA